MSTRIKPYPLVHVRMNRYGHIELSKVDGSRKLECDVYLQLQADVDTLLDSLPKAQAQRVREGYDIKTHFVSTEYFGA